MLAFNDSFRLELGAGVVAGARLLTRSLAVLVVALVGNALGQPQQSPAFPNREWGALPTSSQTQSGVTAATHAAVRKGLLWLARHQEDDGSWSNRTCRTHCPVNKPCQPETATEPGSIAARIPMDVGLTSLALLAFLGAGIGPDAPQSLADTDSEKTFVLGQGVVLKGLTWLAEHQRADGSFSDAHTRSLYNEAIAAAALAEAYGMAPNESRKAAAQRAIDYLSAAQKPKPQGIGKWGWRYASASDVEELKPDFSTEIEFKAELSDSDVSVTTWASMALKSAQLVGLTVPKDAVEGALAYVKWASDEDGLVGYTDPKFAGQAISGDHDTEFSPSSTSMACAGMCVRIFLEHNPADDYLKKSADQIIQSPPSIGQDPTDKSRSRIDYYYWYYGSLALNQFDGPGNPKRSNKYWSKWSKAMQASILASQSVEPHQCANGGFLKPDRWSFNSGPVYSTAINVLTLETYYRYENAFAAAPKKAH